jgi:hypothetical protein
MGDFTGFMPEETGAEQIRVESFFKPNLQLLDRVLGTRQQMYNTNLDTMAKAKAKVEEVNSLEGFDRNEWMNMQENYDKDIQGIMSLYEGDLSKANGELSGFTSKVGKDFGIHGKATAINERALGYMMNKKELDKRLAEGKIEHQQYWKLSKELEDTKDIGIGEDAKAYKGWRKINPMDAVKFPEFAAKFLAHKKADLRLKGYSMNQRGDFIEFTKTGAETISYDEVINELTTAYNAEAEKTGQLRDAFDYHVYNNKINLTKDSYIQTWSGKVSEYQDRINKLSMLKGTQLQEYINSIGGQLKVDNIIDTEVITTKMALIDQAKRYVEAYNEKIDVVADDTRFNQQQVENLYYREFIDSEARKQADPYARAISHSRDILEHDVHRDPRADFNYAKALKDYEKLDEQVAPIVNYTHGETIKVESVIKAREGLKMKKSELKDLEERMVNNPMTMSPQYKKLLQNRIDEKKTEIYNIETNYNHIQQEMRSKGYVATDDLLHGELKRLTSISDPSQLQAFESQVKTGNDYKEYLDNKEMLLSGLSDAQKKTLFNGETNNAKIIKTYFAKQTEPSVLQRIDDLSIFDARTWSGAGRPDHFEIAKRNANLVSQMVNMYNQDESGEMAGRFINYVGDKISETDGGTTELLAMGRTSADAGFNRLRNQNEENVTSFTENNTIEYLTKTTETITVDPTINNHVINQQAKAWHHNYATNSAAYLDINGKQFDLTSKTFYNAKGEIVSADKHKSTIELAAAPVNGRKVFIVKHRDSEGKPLYDKPDVKNRKEYQSMISPVNEDEDGLSRSMQTIGLSELNWAKTAFRDKTGKYLSQGEQQEADDQRRSRYDGGLKILAYDTYMPLLQKQKIDILPLDGSKLVNFGGRNLSVHRDVNGVYAVYMPYTEGSSKGKPNFAKPVEFYNPNNAYDIGVGRSVPDENKTEFGSIEELSKSLYYNLQLRKDLPSPSWESTEFIPPFNP